MFIEFRTVKNTSSAKVTFLHRFVLQIHSSIWLQKINVLDLSLIKLLQNQQECNFLCPTVYNVNRPIELMR